MSFTLDIACARVANSLSCKNITIILCFYKPTAFFPIDNVFDFYSSRTAEKSDNSFPFAFADFNGNCKLRTLAVFIE